MANTPKLLQIFKPGTHTAMSGATLAFSDADLAASVAAYDPARFEAPLVVGHPQLDAPAYGWVKSLTFAGGTLEAEPQQVDPAFAALVNAGRFKKISAAFFHPSAPNNPVPGVFYLRHVGFLGAQAPAVKGLRTPSFNYSDTADCVVFEFAESDFLPPPKEMLIVTPEEKALLEAENAQLKQQLSDAQAAAKAQAFAQVNSAHTAFADGLVAAGKLLPAEQSLVVATLNLFASESPQFGEAGHEKPLLDAFKSFASALPQRVAFAETATAAKAATMGHPRVEFAAPQGYGVDADALATHRKALAWQAEHQTDYLTAVRAVS